VPEGLHHGRKTGTFPLRLRDKAAGNGGFRGITGRWTRLAGQNRRKNAAAYPVPGVGVCPRREPDVPIYRPIRPTPPPRNPAVNRTGLQSKCRNPGYCQQTTEERDRLTKKYFMLNSTWSNGNTRKHSMKNTRSMRKISDLTRLRLLEEAEKLGILNIDVIGDQLTLEVIQNAIEATTHLNSRLDKEMIAQKLRKADGVVAALYR
jgi:hypothetical protein